MTTQSSPSATRVSDGIDWVRAAPWLVGSAILFFGYLPLIFLGPGTDLDTAGVYQAGRAILSGDYVASRRPGAPVYETLAGVLHAVGGIALVNAASVCMAAALALAVVRLLRNAGSTHPEWLGVVVLANPFIWIAGTSMIDHIWAIGFAMLGAVAQQSRRWGAACVLYVLAIGCRLPAALIVAALLLADWLGPERDRRRRLLAMAGVILLLTALIFLPSALTLRGEMFSIGVPQSTWPVRVGRSVVKNIYFFGPVVLVLVAVLLPRLVKGVRVRWRDSSTLRMGILVFVAAELLFLDFPWKLAHLIPAWVALVLVLGSTRVVTRPVLIVLIISQFLLGAIALNVAQPNVSNAATGGRLAIALTRGPLLRDIQCRSSSDREAYRRPDGVEAVLPVWACVVPWSSDIQ